MASTWWLRPWELVWVQLPKPRHTRSTKISWVWVMAQGSPRLLQTSPTRCQCCSWEEHLRFGCRIPVILSSSVKQREAGQGVDSERSVVCRGVFGHGVSGCGKLWFVVLPQCKCHPIIRGLQPTLENHGLELQRHIHSFQKRTSGLGGSAGKDSAIQFPRHCEWVHISELRERLGNTISWPYWGWRSRNSVSKSQRKNHSAFYIHFEKHRKHKPNPVSSVRVQVYRLIKRSRLQKLMATLRPSLMRWVQ